ncbi:11935_t:CDS:2 [Gigaspora margarita]|uniref:11935_t:CDS:1 n=1 Tax=Gigaspora margarita TaxID=4874 RepID=A0ABN7VMN1_GIGMA|nr:11935_t:CDS:2 [Gigaspora margarita]
MVLLNYFQKRYKEYYEEHKNYYETHIFFGVRLFVNIIGLILFLAYLVYLLVVLTTDKPITKTEYIFMNEIDIPVQNFGDRRDFCRIFRANKTVKYTDPEKELYGLRKVGFYFQITNLTDAEEASLGIASISIQLTSPDFNPLIYPGQDIDNMDKAIKSHLLLQWNFIPAMAGYSTVVRFRTRSYKSILPVNIGTFIGWESNYNHASFIESEVSQFPFNQNPFNMPNGTTGYFSVSAGIYVFMNISRTTTILSIISSAGGFYGAMMYIYSRLYGNSPLKPWGIFHKHFVSTGEIIRCDNICEKDQCECIEQKLSEFNSFKNFISNYWAIPSWDLGRKNPDEQNSDEQNFDK